MSAEAHETCSCGAEITVKSTDAYSSDLSVRHRLEEFRKAHAGCRESTSGEAKR